MEEQQVEHVFPSDAAPRDRHGTGLSLPRNLLRVPCVKQRTDFSCGSAATLALLRYWRWDLYERVEEADLYLPLETTRQRGTEPQPIASLLNSVPGLSAAYRHGDVTIADLERAVGAGEPPIVDLQAWRDRDTPWRDVWDAGHYVVLVGYDDERLFFMDPSTGTPGPYAYLAREELEERWHDLSGERDEPVAHMAIFVHAAVSPDRPEDTHAGTATQLG